MQAPAPKQSVATNHAESASFPEGLQNAYFFAMFNALSFQIVLGSPMVLYAKALGASATVLGIITGMMPLLVIFQIPAAAYVSRVGYKRFVYAGWGMRVLFIFVIALVPLTTSFLNLTTQLALILTLLFAFNLSRGISSCAWLPWITSLVPEPLRGKYLATDAAWINIASFATTIIAAFALGQQPRPAQFALIFFFSALMGAISLSFLKRIPEIATPEQTRASNTPVPWTTIFNYPPFQKLLRMAIAWSIAYGGMTAFTVAFMKSHLAFSEQRILLLTSVAFLGGFCSIWILGSRLDQVGSKPVLGVSLILWVIISISWTLLAGHALQPWLPIIIGLQLLMGLFAALVGMSNTRLAMAISPVMGRSHFFALYSVLSNVVLGLAPVGWGLLIDAIGSYTARTGRFEWNRYTIFFAAVAVAFTLSMFIWRRIDEPKAASMESLLREVLLQSPQRVLVRLWPRQ